MFGHACCEHPMPLIGTGRRSAFVKPCDVKPCDGAGPADCAFAAGAIAMAKAITAATSHSDDLIEHFAPRSAWLPGSITRGSGNCSAAGKVKSSISPKYFCFQEVDRFTSVVRRLWNFSEDWTFIGCIERNAAQNPKLVSENERFGAGVLFKQ
jgi:hypothetical protein